MYTPILATLGFILSQDRKSTLLVHRHKRHDDHHQGKYNGLGGKMRHDESVIACLHREIWEEAGIRCLTSQLRGTINWPEFGPNGENWLGFIFTIIDYQGSPMTENEEGSLGWHPIETLATLPMWPGDRFFLPLVFDQDPRPFHGFMPYHNGVPQKWQYTR